jgi:hypothetical protein
MTVDSFFAGKPQAKKLFKLNRRTVEAIGPSGIRATKSQIAFRRRRAFAWAWQPGQYLRGQTAPLVLSIFLPWRNGSSRWKEIVEPTPGRFMHHLELFEPGDIDEQVSKWLRDAWEAAA